MSIRKVATKVAKKQTDREVLLPFERGILVLHGSKRMLNEDGDIFITCSLLAKLNKLKPGRS